MRVLVDHADCGDDCGAGVRVLAAAVNCHRQDR